MLDDKTNQILRDLANKEEIPVIDGKFTQAIKIRNDSIKKNKLENQQVEENIIKQ